MGIGRWSVQLRRCAARTCLRVCGAARLAIVGSPRALNSALVQMQVACAQHASSNTLVAFAQHVSSEHAMDAWKLDGHGAWRLKHTSQYATLVVTNISDCVRSER